MSEKSYIIFIYILKKNLKHNMFRKWKYLADTTK